MFAFDGKERVQIAVEAFGIVQDLFDLSFDHKSVIYAVDQPGAVFVDRLSGYRALLGAVIVAPKYQDLKSRSAFGNGRAFANAEGSGHVFGAGRERVAGAGNLLQPLAKIGA